MRETGRLLGDEQVMKLQVPVSCETPAAVSGGLSWLIQR